MSFVCFNGDFLPSAQPLITAQNPCFKWGEGVFETIRFQERRIQLAALHFDRLELSLRMLGIKSGHDFSRDLLTGLIEELCRRNHCAEGARVRLAVYRNEEGAAGYVIEAGQLAIEYHGWNGTGWEVDLYPYARKNTDAFSNLKTANFLPYVLAGRFAREKGWDDALVLNADNRICDSSRANIFLLSKGNLITPALNQGCINGVMRRYLCEELSRRGYRVRQQEVTVEDLLGAEEVFLTNALFGMRQVGRFREKQYPAHQSFALYKEILLSRYA